MKQGTIIYLNGGELWGVFAGTPEEYARKMDYTVERAFDKTLVTYDVVFYDKNSAVSHGVITRLID